MTESAHPLLWLLAMISITPLVARSKDNLLAWAVVLLSFFLGLQAHDMVAGTALLLAYAMIDGIAGVLVARPGGWQFRLMGAAYGSMGLSHVLLHFHFMEPLLHDFIGTWTGWMLFGLLTFMGIWNGGHRDRSGVVDTVVGATAHAVAAKQEAG